MLAGPRGGNLGSGSSPGFHFRFPPGRPLTARRRARPKRRKPEAVQPEPAPRSISVRAYARLRDVSHTAVLKAIREGRIRTRPDGSIDPVAADRDWDGRTDPSKPLNSVCGNPKHRRPPGGPPTPVRGRRPRKPGSPAAAGGEPGPPPDMVPHQENRYIAARGTREEIAARRAQIQLDELEGRKIDKEAARQAIMHLQRRLRDRVLKFPHRATPEIAALTGGDPHEIMRILDREAREIARDAARAVLPGTPGLPDDPEDPGEASE